LKKRNLYLYLRKRFPGEELIRESAALHAYLGVSYEEKRLVPIVNITNSGVASEKAVEKCGRHL